MAIAELREVASKHGQEIYNICFRAAGVGIQFHDHKKVRSRTTPTMTAQERGQQMIQQLKEGLYIDKYYETLEEAIKQELKRISKL
jgi:hypothetical protein